MAKLLKTIDNSTYAMYDAYSNWYFRQYPVIEVYRTEKSSKFYNPLIADGFRRDFSFKAMINSPVVSLIVASGGFGIPLYLMLFGSAATGIAQMGLFAAAALFFLSYPLFAAYSHIVLKSTDKTTVDLKNLGFKSETSKEDLISYFNKNTAQAKEFIDLTIEKNKLHKKLENAVVKIEESKVKSGESETIDFVVKDIENKVEVLKQQLKAMQSEIKSLITPALQEGKAKTIQHKEQELLLVASSM